MADQRVASAVAHWGPRLIANGVDYNDFLRTTARVERWADWCAEWMRTAAAHEALARECDARNAAASAAEARVRAALCHHFGKFLFFEDPSVAGQAHEAMLANFRLAAPHLQPPAEHVEIPFLGLSLPGYLRRPPGDVGRRPVVVLVPGLDSTKEEFHTFEPLFHRRGLATLAIDGPGQGELERHLTLRADYEVVMSAALDWIAQHPGLNDSRVGAVGVSLGGYYVARAAAFEHRLRGVADIAGPYDWGACWDGLPPLTREAFTRRSGASDEADARPRADALTLADAAHRIRGGLLVVHGARDTLIPVEQARRLHAEAPTPIKQLAIYADGNHVCNNMPYAYRPLVADWLAEQLSSS